MHSLELLNDFISQYGLYAVFLLVMIEGDITLLLAGVLAHSHFFGDYSFAQVLWWGTLGGFVSDNIAYLSGRGFCESVREFRFYRAAQPRIQKLTNKFGPLSIFLSKYIYGIRWASCVFYGVGRMPYLRFLALSFASCFLWVFILAGAGYFFSGAVIGLIGDFQRVGKFLLIIVLLGVVAFYLVERFWLSPKVEKADPELLHDLQDLGQEVREHMHFKQKSQNKNEGDGQ